MDPEPVFCDGPTVCGSEHGLCGSVQGSGDFGRTNRVLDIAYHVAVDDQIPVEPLPGNFPYQKILRRHDTASERRSVRPCSAFASSASLLRRYGRGLRRCRFQRCHARHRGRRSLHVGAIACVPGEIHRLAGCVLQPCETGRHGRPGVVRRFSLRRLQRRGCSNIRRLRTFVDGGACHSLRPARPAGRLPCPGASRRGRRCRTAFAAGWPVGSARGHRRLFSRRDTSGIISPSSSCTGWARAS